MLGDGPLRSSLQRLVRSLGAAGRIRFVGHTQEVTSWLARADALVLTSDYEGLPAVVVEALASGVPILATRCSEAMDELIGHGRFGRLVACDDELALAMALGQPMPQIRVPGTPMNAAISSRRGAAIATQASASPPCARSHSS